MPPASCVCTVLVCAPSCSSGCSRYIAFVRDTVVKPGSIQRRQRHYRKHNYFALVSCQAHVSSWPLGLALLEELQENVVGMLLSMCTSESHLAVWG